jgi:CelD/BcsL family acetyltransferase involved in cellulose biosynthesis
LGAALPLPQTDKAAAISPAPAVVVLRGTSAIGEIVPAWDELAGAALEPNPFYESWMLRPAIEHLAAGQDIQLVTVWAGDKLGALLPVQRQRRYKGLPIRTLRAWRHRHCLLGTPLVRAEGEATYVAALVEWFRKAASVVELDYLPADGPVYRLLTRTPLAAVPWEGYERALFRRARDADTYVATAVSRQDRQEVRRRERRLAERGAVAHVTLRPGDSLERWLGELLQLEAGGWKGKQGSALACSESNRRFATEIFTAAYRRGRLHMVGLDLDGKPLARCSSILAGSGGYAFKTAYDEAFARFSPGVIVEVDRIRALHDSAEVQWMDSFTDAGNVVLNRLWNERLKIQGLVFATGTLGRLALDTLPLLRRAKRWFQRRKTSDSASRTSAVPASTVSVTASPSSSQPQNTPSTGTASPTVSVREGPMSRISVKKGK